ncbi:MAG: N-acetyltransferase [Myxococcales bacterium]|nr:N-acetyltransferase [Myxococcales bacterium]
MSAPEVTLRTPRLVLREFAIEDAPALNAIESIPSVMRYTMRDAQTPEESLEYVRERLAERAQDPRRTFDLVVTREGEFLGRCGIQRTDVPLREAMIWFVIDPRSWGQGFASEAAEAVIGWAFEALALHRIYGDCDPRNTGSARVMEKLGMRREAHIRENVFLKGEWCDSWIYALLDHEWRARRR